MRRQHLLQATARQLDGHSPDAGESQRLTDAHGMSSSRTNWRPRFEEATLLQLAAYYGRVQ